MGRSSSKREEIYAFLKDYIASHGYPPTTREIMAGVGLRSTASVHYHLSELNRSGAIEMDGGKNRAISLGAEAAPQGVPLVGVVTAGQPILAVENIEGYVPWEAEAGCFALRVRGDSMIEAGIFDGDKVVGLMTYGGQSKYNGRDLDSACRLKFANLLCMYGCPGFDTYGPFKFVGGMNKDRPNQEDIDGAVAFYDRLVDDYGEIIIEERIKRDKQDAFNAAHPAGGLLTNIKRTAKKIANRGKMKDGANAPAAGQQEAAHAHDAADSVPSQAPEAAQNGNSDPSGSAEE
jgi:hypothetical protein